MASAGIPGKRPPASVPAAPSAWLRRFLALLPRDRPVLDLAAGQGRHARFLLACGFAVTAVDVDTDGLADLAAAPRAEVVRADLEGAPWPLGGRRFGTVLVANYLHRPLFPHLLAALAPGGVLLYETFAQGNEAYGRPRNPDFLLRPNELLAAFQGHLTVVAYEHGLDVRPRPAVRQRLCALNGPGPVALPSWPTPYEA